MRAVRALGAIGLGAVLGLSGLTVTPAAAGRTYYVPVTDQITVRGHGYGHGNGMSQHGAEGAARAGKSYREILSKYYPGTRLGTMRGRIRVLISGDTTSDVKVSPTRGLTLRDRADGGTWKLPTRAAIGRWRILRTGRVQFHNGSRWRRWDVPKREALRGEGEFVADRPITLWVPSGGGEVGRRYRGALRSSNGDTVNVLRMDSYIRGVVPAEMPPSWSMEALKSQAVAARTYATRDRSANRSRYYQTCDTTACQVYGGVASEYPSTNRAVRATARRILRYQGDPAFTQFSSSSGGYTGDGGYPYLKPQPDPWDDWSGNSVHTWRQTVSATRIERRYPALGRLQAIRVTKRNGYGQWNGRVLRMTLDGSRNDVSITGDDFRWLFGLRSTWFVIDDTAIMQRWKRIGAARSRVGRPVTSERAAARDGAVQRFERGRIFWHRRTGARETYGPILGTYLRAGGAKRLGYPRTGVVGLGRRDAMVIFQRGRIYRNRPTGVHVVRRGWLRAYRRADLHKGRLGLPTSDIGKWKRGRQMRFQGGYITRNRAGAFRVHLR